MSLRKTLVAAALALGLVVPGIGLGLLLPAAATAQEREDPSRLPFYARIPFSGDSPWTVVIFYRPPSCVPRDFNLVRFIDAPRAFGCGPQTVYSWGMWATGIGEDPAPRQSRAHGLGAVPIWLVPTEALNRADSDGVLTMPELEALNPLRGTADFYTEVLHPRESVKNSLLVINARGELEDGRSFAVHLTSLPPRRFLRVTIGD